LKSNFQHYYEMALRIKDKSPTYLYNRDERNSILDAYKDLKKSLSTFGFNIHREPENEFFGVQGDDRVHGKLFKAEINVNGTFDFDELNNLTAILRKLETKYKALDFDFQYALIQHTNKYAFDLSVFPESTLQTKKRRNAKTTKKVS